MTIVRSRIIITISLAGRTWQSNSFQSRYYVQFIRKHTDQNKLMLIAYNNPHQLDSLIKKIIIPSPLIPPEGLVSL